MKFRKKFLVGIVLSLLSTFAVAQITRFICCSRADKTEVWITIDSCEQVKLKPSNKCTAQICDENVKNCQGVYSVGSAVINHGVSSQVSSAATHHKILSSNAASH